MPYHIVQGGRLWGGRFTGNTDPIMEAFNASITFDKRMWAADIEVIIMDLFLFMTVVYVWKISVTP